MTTRKILVTGATGKQGNAVVQSLLAHPPPFDHQILALTRKSTSPAAKALAANSRVTIIEGDLEHAGEIFTQAGGIDSIWGVFLMTLPVMKKEAENSETRQGNKLIDAAIEHGVRHLVFSSVDRGGSQKSEVDATDVPHFISKVRTCPTTAAHPATDSTDCHVQFNIEKHLIEKVRGTQTTYTILRPVAFMENFTPTFGGRMFAAMWESMGTKPLQLISTKDIGVFAAQALAAPETGEYKNTAISLAGDELTQAQANEVFWKVFGRPMPRSYGFMAALLQRAIPELGIMFRWFVSTGYGADITHDRLLYSGLHDFEAWLREESGFKR